MAKYARANAHAAVSRKGTVGAHERKPARTPRGPVATVGAAAGHGRCSCALLYGPEGDCGRDARRGTTAGANAPNRRSSCEWRRHDASIDAAGRNDRSEASTTMSSSCASANITGEINVWPPRWFAKNVRQVCDRVVGRPCRYRETVRSEMAIPSFSNSPWIRGAPQRQFSAAIRRIRSRQGESMRGLPGRRERRRQHRRTPSRCQRSTVAGWTSTSASRHRGHNHRKNSQNRRSAGRKRLFERARTPSWWRRARVSSRRSRRVARADRTAAPVLMTARIARRVPTGDANVNDFWPDAILARHSSRTPRLPAGSAAHRLE